MAVIDTLQVLIEADARGLETTMKKAIDIATGAVGEINKQEVDWTSIFSRSVSPAIISSVASMFAFAIAQSVQFQTAMAQTGTAAGESSQQIAQMSQQALDMSKNVPASAEELAGTMTQVSAIFGTNTAATQEITQAIAELAASGFGSLNDITQVSMDLFRQWGVTTSDEAIQVLTDLMHAAQGTKESIPSIGQQFAAVTPPLIEAGMHLKDFNNILSGFAAQVQTVGPDQAKAVFEAIATGASDASSPMAIFGGGVEKLRSSLRDNGGLDVIQRLSTVFSRQFGDNVGLIAKSFGLTATQVEGLINEGKQLPTIASNQEAIAKSAQDINGAYGESNSTFRQLILDLNQLKAAAIELGGAFAPLATIIGNVFVNAAQDAEAFFKHLTDFIGSGFSVMFGNSFKNAFKDMWSSAGGIADDVLKPIQQAMNGAYGLISGNSSFNQVNQRLGGTGVGFDTGTLGRIDQTAQQNSLIQSLVSALSTGIQPGQYTQLVNTFHLNVPTTGGLSAKDIARQLYAQFQGQP